MEAGGVVPDVIPKVPEHVVKVTFENNLSVDLGNVLTPTQVQNPPMEISYPTEPDTFYTLILTDPDAPSRADPKFREWHHWIVGNIPGTKVKEGETLSDYIGSGPPPKTGLHRYVYLVYKQPGKIDFKDTKKLTNRSGNGREKFKAVDFATKYNLTLWAGNYYQAEFDDYVPKLYEQLGG